MSFLSYPPAMRRLVSELQKLPSVGERSASRLAYHLLTCDEKDAICLSDAIVAAREKIRLCDVCHGLTEEQVCSICADPKRNAALVCVVEKPVDLIALERSGSYRGVYHVLHGLWSPLRGISPEQTKMLSLFHRIKEAKSLTNGSAAVPVQEVVIATSATVEGDATALYIAATVNELGVRVSRLAQGMPKGGELEYADEVTISHAMHGRRILGS